MEPVSEALGKTLSRGPLLAVLNRLYDQLQNNYEQWRGRRSPQHFEDCFDYVLTLADDDNVWHTFRFTVNDRTAADYLFVVSVSHRTGKFRH